MKRTILTAALAACTLTAAAQEERANGSCAFAIPSGAAPEHTAPEKLTVLVVAFFQNSNQTTNLFVL